MGSSVALRWIAYAMLLGLLSGCWRMVPPGVSGDVLRYRVVKGDTLYSISWRYGYDYREVAAWNNIPPPYSIYPGEDLVLFVPYGVEPRPRQAVTSTAGPKHTTTTARPPVTAGTTSSPAVSAPVSRPPKVQRNSSTSRRVEKGATSHHQKKITWRWPSQGEIASSFNPGSGKKGLDIRGKLGQSVVAAAAGEVVYSGSGLIGYGNLIIIKHNDVYLSAYGHNRRLLVKEGASVAQGEKIAEMGESGKEGVILHFEIRRDGKPVNPIKYLPKRRN